MLNILYKIYIPIRRFFFSLLRLKTIGVRALILEGNQVLLVKHTYLSGWYFPGGGVNHKETPENAAIREVFEETGGTVVQAPELLSVFYNPRHGWDDYVVLYKMSVDTFQKMQCREIAEVQWFSIDSLPKDTSTATLKRLEEYQQKQYSHLW